MIFFLERYCSIFFFLTCFILSNHEIESLSLERGGGGIVTRVMNIQVGDETEIEWGIRGIEICWFLS